MTAGTVLRVLHLLSISPSASRVLLETAQVEPGMSPLPLGATDLGDAEGNLTIVFPAHRQPLLHITGNTGTGPHRNFYINVQLIIRGAQTRAYSHPLCTAVGSPQLEQKTCSTTAGHYDARVWLFVPDFMRPVVPLSAAVSLKHSDTYEQHLAMLTDFGFCRDSPSRYSRAFRHGVCGKKKLPAYSAIHSAIKNSPNFGQVVGSDFRDVGLAFLQAATTLPQPFAIVEHGNLCGLMTIYLAILRRYFCPRCPLYSTDPGLFRTAKKQRLACVRDALNWAGIHDPEITLADDAGAAVQLSTDVPVGFAYLDDGKLRVFNDPLVAMLHERLMVGGVLAFDDTWDPIDKLRASRKRSNGTSESGVSVGHIGHSNLVHELLSGGDYAELFVGGMNPGDAPKALGPGGEVTDPGFREFVRTIGTRKRRKTSAIRKVRSHFAPIDATRGGLQQHAIVTVHNGYGDGAERASTVVALPELESNTPPPRPAAQRRDASGRRGGGEGGGGSGKGKGTGDGSGVLGRVFRWFWA